MRTERRRIHFHDEFRNIPCGMRLVEIRKGRAWVYIRQAGKVPGRWSKMKRNIFEETFGENATLR